ncbi:hypothetical protein QBB33_39175 [Streptomyces scabiei]|uniref:hypothetical protein n=1 Tax=Streptomyces scabiei TaxID=1930 RepID=UPI001FF0C873|nr:MULTISPECIES: hypothetical protein [Streptomyces]MDX3029054.1 hypothetical protein [Streptomyces scabiei]MDX3207978.1 hypothetical protein [Streptomyces scabiei]
MAYDGAGIGVRALARRALPARAGAGGLSVEAEDVPEFRREVTLPRSRLDEVIRKALEIGGGVLAR